MMVVLISLCDLAEVAEEIAVLSDLLKREGHTAEQRFRLERELVERRSIMDNYQIVEGLD